MTAPAGGALRDRGRGDRRRPRRLDGRHDARQAGAPGPATRARALPARPRRRVAAAGDHADPRGAGRRRGRGGRGLPRKVGRLDGVGRRPRALALALRGGEPPVPTLLPGRPRRVRPHPARPRRSQWRRRATGRARHLGRAARGRHLDAPLAPPRASRASRRGLSSTPAGRAAYWRAPAGCANGTGFRNLAVYAYFADATRLDGEEATNILVEATAEGWVWVIPFERPPHASVVSVGVVLDAQRAAARP